MNMIGPQLSLHDDRELWLHPIQKTRRCPRQVVGQITMLNTRFIGEQGLNTLRTGRRHARHSDRQLRILLEQCANHRCRGNTLAHRHRMHPNPTGLQRGQIHGKPLPHTLGIRWRLARPQPQTNRHQRQPQMKQQGVESSIHGGRVYLKTVFRMMALSGARDEHLRPTLTTTKTRYTLLQPLESLAVRLPRPPFRMLS